MILPCYIGPNPIIPRAKQNTQPVVIKQGLSGKASGKKRLAEVMDHDISQKKKHRKSSSPPMLNQSKFFHTPSESMEAWGIQRRHSDGVIAVTGSSKLEEKENLYIVVDDEAAETSESDLDGSDISLKAQYDHDTDMDLHLDEFPDVVEQEDGYISPTPSCSKDLQDLSSPPRPSQTPAHRKWKSDQRQQVDDLAMMQNDEDAYFGVEAVSSPVSTVKRHVSPFIGRGFIQETPTKRNPNEGDGCILVQATPTPTQVQYSADEIPSPILYYGPDLRNALTLATDGATDLDCDDDDDDEPNRQELRRKPSYPESRYNSGSPPSPSPDTSDSARSRQRMSSEHVKLEAVIVDEVEGLDGDDLDAEQARANASRTEVIMRGWRDRWALTSKTKKAVQIPAEEGKSTPLLRALPNEWIPGSRSSRTANLKRSDTNVTPQGRHSLSRPSHSVPSKMVTSGGNGMKSMGKARRSILFVDQKTRKKPCAHGKGRKCTDMVEIMDSMADSTSTNGVGVGAGVVSGRLDDIALRAHERLSMFR